jgi:hypothetical protein
MNSTNATVVGLVTLHLLHIVDLANDAEKAINVDWHVRDAVARTMAELGDQANASKLIEAFIEGLENAAGQAPRVRAACINTLRLRAACFLWGGIRSPFGAGLYPATGSTAGVERRTTRGNPPASTE